MPGAPSTGKPRTVFRGRPFRRFLQVPLPLSAFFVNLSACYTFGTRHKATEDFAIMQEKEQKISPIKQRILQFAEYLGISKRDFYKTIGVSRGTLESKTGITEDVMAKFIATYPNVSIRWLITGYGEMMSSVADSQTRIIPAKKTDDGDIPLIPIEAVAGVLSGNSAAVMDYECEHYSIPMFSGAEFLIQVHGDSMQPKYYSGDIVACKRLPLNTFFQWNRVYVVDSEQGVIIKRIRRGSDERHVVLVSENPIYEPFELPLEKIYSIALVMGVVRAE